MNSEHIYQWNTENTHAVHQIPLCDQNVVQ